MPSTQTSAVLVVGINRTGNGIPAAGWPNGSGYTAYKWRLDTDGWSAETPIALPILLSGIADGAHHVEVIGKNDAGFYQNDPIFGSDAVVTISPTWHIQSAFQLTPGTYVGTTYTLQFPAAAGNSYSVLYRDAFDPAHPWTKLLDVPAPASPAFCPCMTLRQPRSIRLLPSKLLPRARCGTSPCFP